MLTRRAAVGSPGTSRPAGVGGCFAGGGIAEGGGGVLGSEDGRCPVDERARQDFAGFVAGRSAGLLRVAYVLTADQHGPRISVQFRLRGVR
jgi:hypothetical protein